MSAPAASAAATDWIVAGRIHGMSASATIQPDASGDAMTPQARLAPMPSCARAHSITCAPASRSRSASMRSSGRTTAIVSGSAATRWRQAATPIGVPGAMSSNALGKATSNLSLPKRSLRPAASRIPTIRTACLICKYWRGDSADSKGALPKPILFGDQPELPILDGDEHAGAFIHAVVIGGRNVEHALAPDDFVLAL